MFGILICRLSDKCQRSVEIELTLIDITPGSTYVRNNQQQNKWEKLLLVLLSPSNQV